MHCLTIITIYEFNLTQIKPKQLYSKYSAEFINIVFNTACFEGSIVAECTKLRISEDVQKYEHKILTNTSIIDMMFYKLKSNISADLTQKNHKNYENVLIGNFYFLCSCSLRFWTMLLTLNDSRTCN